MTVETIYLVLFLAASLGVLITLLGLGYFKRKPEPEEAARMQARYEAQHQPPPPEQRARPGAGPCHAWFLPGGGSLGQLRFKRNKEAALAIAHDLNETGRLHISVGAKKKVAQHIRALPWGEEEAGFLNRPADAFLLVIDRPLERFDPRHDRYVIVPIGFMEGAGGLEAFLGAFAFDIMANARDPMEAAEQLLRDAAEAAMAAGFAPPDVLKVLVEMFRRQVFTGRYKPLVGHGHPPQAAGPGHPPPGSPPGGAPGGPAGRAVPPPPPGGPAPSDTPLKRPAAPAKPPGGDGKPEE